MSSIPPSRLRLLSAAVALLVCASARADISDTIHPFVAIGYTYDDNLLRLPDDFAGVTQRSDTARQAQAGLIVDRPIGRQRLTGSAKVSRVTFDHYNELDYNGKDFKGDLAWQLGNRFSGNLGGTYQQTLTPFTDFHTSERNLRVQRQEYVNGAWRLHPSWQVRSGYTRSRYEYELQAQSINNREEDLTEVGFDFLAASGSRFGLVARRLEGKYTNPSRTNALFRDGYTQDELKANVRWNFSAVTQLNVLAGYAKREYESLSGRDSSGANGRVTLLWAPLNKVKFTVDGWRNFAAVESTLVSNSLNTGASVGATWDISAKLQANASMRREEREFEQLSTVVFDGDVTDRTRGATLGLTYAPTLQSQVSLSAFRDNRDGNTLLRTNSYRAKGLSFNASVQF
ncbi:XrtB/PEP-CTERM-associated polysaccharide biosynthesis outer membrane protein EpsL [Pseudoduganella umbonata]|uniref:Exopolysaccharide biosynthesis operon protein EpsL n=1 Tax=Pseudoduganella umbonata TaxID=864828 RepID=A0A4P8HZJ3_9BURK|nr:XrtB/PEP-CTERM-associated polysaccharide biosynthesis outer membrane protein EpsL [Pseudoduganella umbonata]MBB3223209.1 exopolysaccharide biosynthesis operon protein EpsL [Pseudoduganella umbonata]QCP13865.1 hypothetical protein FCL38_28130 [Pseudoduganella umbonata]